jgi:nucleotide-binding universal stress UspA family protein
MKILHPTDFSQTAEKARRLALSLRERFGGELHLIYVQERFESDERRFLQPTADTLNPEWVRRIEEGRATEVKRIQERLHHLASEGGTSELRWGHPVPEILETAEDAGADVIVMGAHGANRLDAFFLGGTAGRVVRRARRPVLTVREEAEARDVRKVLLATDFGDASRHAWGVVEGWADAGVDLAIAHVVDDPRYHGDADYARRAEEAMREMTHGRDVATLLREGNPIDALPALAAEVGADLIAVGVRRHAGAVGLLLGSRADALLRSSRVPILSVPYRP